jgi:hypothetical protein
MASKQLHQDAGYETMRLFDKEVAPAGLPSPEARRPPEVMPMVSKTRIPRRAVRDEIKRAVLHEALARYQHELLPDEERMLLRDRVLRLKRELGLRGRVR